MFHVDSDYDKAKHVKSNGPSAELYLNLEIAQINDHHFIYYSCRKLPFPLVARDWLQRGIFTQVDDDKFVLAYKFINDKTAAGVPPFTPSTLEKRIRGESTFLYIFERLPHNCCKFTCIMKADIKRSVPKIVAESGLAGVVDSVRQAYTYFERDEEVRARISGLVRSEAKHNTKTRKKRRKKRKRGAKR